MEDHLILAVKNLTAREKDALQKRILHQKQKLKLFHSIDERKTSDNKILSEALEYGNNFTSLYTLKNRLFDDIIEVKLHIKKNPLVVVKEKIQNLRNLVYDKDKVSLLREIKRLEKNAESYELYNELKEVYFCILLTVRHDQKKSVHFQQLMDSCESKQVLTDKLEQLFYMHLLDTPQDMFYSINSDTLCNVTVYLADIELLYKKLDSKAAYFLYQSAYLTIRLNFSTKLENLDNIENELNNLLTIYSNSFLPYKYPYCQIAIQCLFSKFYYLTNNKKRFVEVQNYINSHLEEVEGFQMFDCSYYYYLFVSVLTYIDNCEMKLIPKFLEKHINEEELSYKSDKMKMYYIYLISIKYYYQKEYSDCFTSLMKSRNYFSNASTNSIWVCVENILLSILINLRLKDFDFIYSEIDLLKRLIRKFNMESVYAGPMLSILKSVKTFELEEDFTKITKVFVQIKNELNILKLIDLEIDELN